jgi:uncharacterized paraquat-inducible protein A
MAAEKLSGRNRAALVLSLVSLGLLWPGLTQPALTIKASMEIFGTTRQLTHETRSVVGAVQSLHASGDDFVALLIVLFSILIPLTKAVLLVPILRAPASPTAARLHRLVQRISKWSMADVFAVGMLIALLVAKGTANLSAVAGVGFYCFAAYCLVSNAAFQLLEAQRRE